MKGGKGYNLKNQVARMLVILIAVSMPFSGGATIQGEVTPNIDGTYTYSYSIDNTAGPFDVVAWSLEFNFGIADIDWNQNDVAIGGSVVVPNGGWVAQPGIPVTGLSAQDFISLTAGSDALIGEELNGFSFISALAPGRVTVTEFGSQGQFAAANVVGPSSLVPDGGSTLMLGVLAMGVLCGLHRCTPKAD